MVVTRCPPHGPPGVLEVELLPTYDRPDNLSGYQLQAMGEVEVSVPVPPELSRKDLGDKMTIRVVACDFIFIRHQEQTRWKDASKLVQHDRLEFFKTAPPTSRVKASTLRVSKESTISTLRAGPLALQLGITIKDGALSLALIALSGVSAMLNNGSHGRDPDDVVLVTRLPTISTEGAIVFISPSGSSSASTSKDSRLQSFFNEFLRDHALPGVSPGYVPSHVHIGEDFRQLMKDYPDLGNPAIEAPSRASSEDMDTTGPTPSTSSESSHRDELVPPISDPSKPGNKYDLVIPDF